MGIDLATWRTRIGLNYYRQCRNACRPLPAQWRAARWGVGEIVNSTPLVLQGCMAVVSLSLILEYVFRRWGVRSKGSSGCGKVRCSKLGADLSRAQRRICSELKGMAVVCLSLVLEYAFRRWRVRSKRSGGCGKVRCSKLGADLFRAQRRICSELKGMAVVSLSLVLEYVFCRLGGSSKGSSGCGKVHCSRLGGGFVPSAEARGMAGVGSGVCLLLRVCAVVLSLLLIAGDVERNPGPTDKEGYDQVEKLLHNVNDSPLGENDHFAVLTEMMPIVGRWKAIGEGLQLGLGFLDTMDNHNPRDCMSAVLKHWLRRNYDVELFGEPSWRTVVKVVGHSAAGSNFALAMSIAETHSVVTGTATQTSTRKQDSSACASNTVSEDGTSVSPRPISSSQSEGSQKPPFGSATPQTSKQTPIGSQEDSCASSTVSDDVFTSEGTGVSPRPSSSSQSEGSQKPPFGCGCGECTFLGYIESGCPNPIPSASSFPCLDLCGLTHEQQEELQSKLCVESEDIMIKFQDLLSTVYESLCARSIPVDKLVTHLLLWGAFDPVYKGSQKPVFQAFSEKLQSAGSIEKVIFLIKDYFSFVNYHVLEHIVHKLGTDQDKDELRKYKEEFDRYSKRRVYECLPDFGPVSKDDHVDLVLKIDSAYEQFTLEAVKKFRYRLNGILHVSQGVLRLCRVEEGCFQVMFQVPSFVQQDIFPLSSEQERALEAEGVIKLTCGDYEFVSKGEEDESEPEDTEPAAELRGPVFQPALTSPDFDTDSAMGTSIFTDDKSMCTFATDEEDPWYKELEQLEYTLHSHELPSEASSEHHRATELHHAARRGDLEAVRLLTEEKHENPLQKDEKGDTGLHTAAEGGSLDVLKYFISEKNYNPACPGYRGRTPLHVASQKGHLNVVKYLAIQQQVDPLCQDENGITPLHFSCLTGDLGIVTVLTEEIERYIPMKGILADLKDKFGSNPLHYAVMYGRLNIVKFFISEKNCSPNIPGQSDRTPLHYASERGHLHIVKNLIDEQGCDPSCLDRDKNTPLHSAASNGHLDIVKFLTLEKHCDPKSRNSYGTAHIHMAAQHGHLDLLKFFITDQNCSPNIPGQYGSTPLHYAAERGQLHIVKYLIDEQGCGPSCLDKDKETPLHRAASKGHLDVVKFLTLEKHCNPNQLTISNNNPLHYAAEKGHLQVVRFFVEELKCPPNLRDEHNMTPHQYAKAHGHLNVALYLLKIEHSN